jgi:hypothetical protein
MTSRLLVDKIEGKTTANTVQMPSGSVIQYKQQQSSTKVTNSANSYVASGVSIAFTPKFSTSIIQVFWEGFLTKLASASGGGGWALFKDSSALHDVASDSGPQPWEFYKDETRFFGRLTRTHSEVAGNTNSRTYTLRFRGYDSMAVDVNNTSGGGTAYEIMTIMEIAQ